MDNTNNSNQTIKEGEIYKKNVGMEGRRISVRIIEITVMMMIITTAYLGLTTYEEVLILSLFYKWGN